jgi:hypothetical protein
LRELLEEVITSLDFDQAIISKFFAKGDCDFEGYDIFDDDGSG